MIVDANVMVSAALGRSFPLLAEARRRGLPLHAPVRQFLETRSVIDRIAGEGQGTREVERLLHFVDPIPEEMFAPHETAARQRLREGGQSDWPVVAAALATEMDVWSNDTDLFGTGVAIWSTLNIQYAHGADSGASNG